MTETIGISEKTLSYERLTDENIGNLLAAIGNHEAKAALYMTMEEDVAYGRPGINTHMIDVQAGEPGYQPSDGAYYQLCAKSLEPIGLVAKIVWDGGAPRFQKVPNIYAEALAGGLADLSLGYPNTALNYIFGSSSSRGEGRDRGVRAPLRRLRIGEALFVMGETVTDTDLVDLCEDNYNSIVSHIWRLAEVNLVTYKSDVMYASDPIIKIPQRIEGYNYLRGFKSITKYLVEAIEENGKAEIPRRELLTVLREQVPEYVDRVGLLSNATQALHYLEKQGLLTIVNLPGSKKRSGVSLSSEQQQLWGKVVELVRGIQMGEPGVIREALQARDQIVRNPSALQALVQKAYQNSAKVTYAEPGLSDQTVLSAVEEGEKLTSREITRRLQGKQLGASAIKNALRTLKRSGHMVSEKQGPYHLWSRSDQTPTSKDQEQFLKTRGRLGVG